MGDQQTRTASVVSKHSDAMSQPTLKQLFCQASGNKKALNTATVTQPNVSEPERQAGAKAAVDSSLTLQQQHHGASLCVAGGAAGGGCLIAVCWPATSDPLQDQQHLTRHCLLSSCAGRKTPQRQPQTELQRVGGKTGMCCRNTNAYSLCRHRHRRCRPSTTQAAAAVAAKPNNSSSSPRAEAHKCTWT